MTIFQFAKRMEIYQMLELEKARVHTEGALHTLPQALVEVAAGADARRKRGRLEVDVEPLRKANRDFVVRLLAQLQEGAGIKGTDFFPARRLRPEVLPESEKRTTESAWYSRLFPDP